MLNRPVIIVCHALSFFNLINFIITAPQPPPVKFSAPIVVADTPKPTYLPPDMPPNPTYLPPGSDHFLPTMPPEDSSANPVIDLLNFPPHVDSSFMPPELEAIKSSIDSNHHSVTEQPSDDPSEQTTNAPSTDLSKFPPNDISYLPPDKDSEKSLSPTYLPPKGITNSSPNAASSYLPPQPFAKSKTPLTSYLPPASGEATPAPEGKSYLPPKDLFNFPPNIDSTYLPPEIMAMMMRAKIPINSYLPPASGDAEGETDSSDALPPNHQPYVAPPDLHNFPPNIDSAYLPPEMMVPEVPDNSYLPPASGNQGDNPNHYAYMPPTDSSDFSDGSGLAPPPQKLPPYMYNPPMKPQPSYPPPGPYTYNPPKPMIKQPKAPGYSYQPPSSGSVSGFQDGSKQNLPGPMMPPAMMQQPMMTAPSGMDMGDPKDLGMSPPMDHDHHHHHDYSDIIYDFDPHHHHHHEEPTTTTTEAPEEPRVKKYSYYYLGRKLWYVPLYFTLWFCLYVAALIIRSIGRHKVN